MSVFDSAPPRIPVDEVLDLARTALAVTIDPTTPVVALAGERDQNVRIGAVVVKVAHAEEVDDALDLQHHVLRHLEHIDPSIPVPRLIDPGTVRHTFTSGTHLVRAVTWLDGVPWAEVMANQPDPQTQQALRRSLGTTMGRLSAALSAVAHPAARRTDFLWDLDRANSVSAWVDDVADPADRALVARVLACHARVVVPVLGDLRRGLVHHDANDRNVLVSGSAVTGIIDFGDMLESSLVNELAVTLAYALMGAHDVVAAAHDVISTYTAAFTLTEVELSVLWHLVAARLAMSIVISSHRSREFPDNEYLLVSQQPALHLLRRITAVRPDLLHAAARHAAGLEPVAGADEVRAWIARTDCGASDVLAAPLGSTRTLVFSLADGAAATRFPAGVDGATASWEWMCAEMTATGATVGLGAYGEDRSCYAGDQFATDAPEPRSVHLGIDLFVDAGTPVHTALGGVVETVVDNDLPFDYGPTVIVRHATGSGRPFWTLYGHMARRTMHVVTAGQRISAGAQVGTIGAPHENGGWAPHVHVQVMTSLLTSRWDAVDAAPDGNFEGAGEPSRMPVWQSVVPDPSALLGLAHDAFDPSNVRR